MAGRFDLFVIFADMRTGSNLLESALNAVPGIACHGEAFNPHFVGYPKRTEILGTGLAAREADPFDLIARMRRAGGLNGFRYFHDHDPRILDELIADPRCAKIVLTRNPVESYVSLQIARQTGQWKLGDARHLKTAMARFDARDFEGYLERMEAFQMQILRGMQVTGQTAFYLDYEDLRDVAVINGLLRFLGAAEVLEALPNALVKQNPEPLEDKVVNFPAMEAALARLDRFNLSRIPSFEPRRGPAVPGFVAAGAAPILFMPLRGGPVTQVSAWLAAISPRQPPESGFSRKSLRDWQRIHPRHRSFTVLRHPVARAHATFCDCILSGRYGAIRDVLRKGYKLKLPPPEAVAEMGAEEMQAAFLGFARFLKANLSGQTSVRVDGAWASQLAVIQGFAEFMPPDALVREERMAADLAALAEAVGVAAPPLPPAAPDAHVPLSAICDAEIEATLREAYQRDYLAFGFGDWCAG